MGAQLPACWPGCSERRSSMPDDTMDQLEGAVAGQLQYLLGGNTRMILRLFSVITPFGEALHDFESLRFAPLLADGI